MNCSRNSPPPLLQSGPVQALSRHFSSVHHQPCLCWRRMTVCRGASSWWTSSPQTSRGRSTCSSRRPCCTAVAWPGTGPMPAGCGQFVCVCASVSLEPREPPSVDFQCDNMQTLIIIVTNPPPPRLNPRPSAPMSLCVNPGSSGPSSAQQPSALAMHHSELASSSSLH